MKRTVKSIIELELKSEREWEWFGMIRMVIIL